MPSISKTRDAVLNGITRSGFLGWLAMALASTPMAAQNFAYVTDSRSPTISMIDTETGTVVDTIPTVGAGVWIAISPDGARAYVTTANPNAVAVIDTEKRTVVDTLPLEGRPWRVAMTPDGARAYVTQQSAHPVVVIDTASHEMVTTDIRGVGDIDLIAMSPDGSRAYLRTARCCVLVVDTTTDTVIATIGPVEGLTSVDGLAIHPDGARVYAPDNYTGTVAMIDLATHRVADQPGIPGLYGSLVNEMVFTPDGTRAYLTNHQSLSVLESNRVTGSIALEAYPLGLAMTPDGAQVYATLPAASAVAVIDTVTNQVVARIPVKDGVRWVAITP